MSGTPPPLPTLSTIMDSPDGNGTPGSGSRTIRTRSTQPACNTCRTRKIRCVRSEGESSCDGCRKHGFQCTVDPRKRGATGLFPERGSSGSDGLRGGGDRDHRDREGGGRIRESSSLTEYVRKPQAATIAQMQARQMQDEMPMQLPQTSGRNIAPRPIMENYGGGNGIMMNGKEPERMIIPQQPPIQYLAQLPINTNPLEAILPRDLIMKSIDIYFQYLYGLIPVVHRPTFLADVQGRREELPGQEEWIALVISLVGVTFAQVPWAFGEMSKKQVKEMVQRCWNKAREWVFGDYMEITVTRCVVFYIGTIISTRLGYASREHCIAACFGSMYQMGLHEESTYIGIDPIEAQIRRRIFWLGIGFDKASQAVQGTSPMHTRDHCATVQLPSTIDDSYLGHDGYQDYPLTEVSPLAGFHYVSRLYGLLGTILDFRRQDRQTPPSGPLLKIRLTEIDGMLTQLMGIMDGCPDELKLKAYEEGSAPTPVEWADSAFQNVQALFQGDNGHGQGKVGNQFLIQQANIYSAQQMARHLTFAYRAELLKLKKAEMQSENPGSDLEEELNLERQEEEETDRAAEDTLKILRSIPIKALAVNGDAVVNKIRLIAVSQLTTLEKLVAAQETQEGIVDSSSRLESAQGYLLNFLSILSDIEALFDIQDA